MKRRRRTRVTVVVDYADTCVSKYLRENEKFCETFFVCSYGVQVEFFDKKVSKISWHCPFKVSMTTLTHGKLFYFGKSKKPEKKVKNVI